MKRIILTIVVALYAIGISAQDFFNLTADDVRIDSLLPVFSHQYELGENYSDSTYSVTIEYPEFIDMGEDDIKRYKEISNDALPSMPNIDSNIAVDRKRGVLEVSFVPLVLRNGKYQKLVSFMLAVKAKAKKRNLTRATTDGESSRYAAHSILASGKWAKIRVPSTGIYELTSSVIKSAGFSDISKVKIYGYGGKLQPETLSGDYLTSTDDLTEVPTYRGNGKVLFRGKGSVSWSSDYSRVRNPYSDYGYYFITENDDAPLTLDKDSFVNTFYPSAEYYNTLYEVDGYAWYHGGRNLYDSQTITEAGQSYTFTNKSSATTGKLKVVVSANSKSVVNVAINGKSLGNINISALGEYDYGKVSQATYNLDSLLATNTVTLKMTSGGDVRLDYIALHTDEPAPIEDLDNGTFDAAEYVYNITNQDHHADSNVDMVIIIPTTQKYRSYAERIATLHEKYDGLTTRIVPADELFNEYSSGTPDATAYRRYMKMMYDRATSDSEMPKYLLLFGGCAYDNRMKLTEWSKYSPDDYLLCYESEYSLSKTISFVADEFFGLLDDNEAIQTGTETGGSSTGTARYLGKPDIAVGRLTVKTESQAETVVSKLEHYYGNSDAGSWQNMIVFMGDDGNENAHMDHAIQCANIVEAKNPAYDVKRILWDAYTRETSSTGNSYPEITRLLKQYMNGGALVMNYSGHGAETSLSHELVLQLSDFSSAVSTKLPLWVTAACDIMPFDTQLDNIGETAIMNENGGAIAFFGTTHTVFTNYNLVINKAFIDALFDTSNGQVSVGEAVRIAKNKIVSSSSDNTCNKLQYALLGDPALKLAMPRYTVVIDSINDVSITDGNIAALKAGMKTKVTGHIANGDSATEDFDGSIYLQVKDVEQEIVCKLQNKTSDGASTAYTYTDRPSTIFKGNSNVEKGKFTINFVVPMDISYSDGNGQVIAYAVNSDKTASANGETEQLTLNGSAVVSNDSIGPSVYCYLNSSSFSNGDVVNSTPHFVAEVSDDNGINAAGSGLGHDIKLVIDGDMAQTYTLNDYFSFDFGSYQSGTVEYSIPEMTDGSHKLKFTVWDILNNSTTSELSFVVNSNQAPTLFDIEATKNPATTSTSFRILHDRTGSKVNATIDLFDMSGRHLWSHSVSESATSNAITVDWDLTIDGGRPLGTGVYLYRVKINCDGQYSESKAKKLIVLNNK